MISFLVLDVIITSVLTIGIVAAIVFLLLSHKYNQTYKKRIDEIMNKINHQSDLFTSQVDDLNKSLKKIIKALNTLKKRSFKSTFS